MFRGPRLDLLVLLKAFGRVQALRHEDQVVQASGSPGPVQALGSPGPVQAHVDQLEGWGTVQTPSAAWQRASPVQALADGPLGALGKVSPEKEIEELRLRLVREAEEHFQREAKKLRGEDGEVRSYHTASSRNGGGCQILAATTAARTSTSPPRGFGPSSMMVSSSSPQRNLGPGQDVVLGAWMSSTLRVRCHKWNDSRNDSRCSCWDGIVDFLHLLDLCVLPRGVNLVSNGVVNSTPMPNGSGSHGGCDPSVVPQRPPGLGVRDPHQAAAGVPEALGNTDLPTLPLPGTEQGALQFGDWITLATPLIGDASPTSREWWSLVLEETVNLYSRWLVSRPLERIRVRAPDVQRGEAYLRIEQRVVPMLLKSMPEMVKADLVWACNSPTTLQR